MRKHLLLGTVLMCGAFLSSLSAADVSKDPATYAARGANGQYKLDNKWLYSNALGNYNAAADLIGTANYVRGMISKDGKLYFIDREKKQLTVVNGTTGAKEAPVKLASNIFTYMGRNKANTADSTYVAGTLPFNDIKIDNAGNVLIGNCITSNAGRFQIWKVDLATGAGTLVLDESTLATEFPTATTLRFDAFGVYGDITKNAIIMAANANAVEAYKWTYTNGVLTAGPELISIDNITAGTYLTGLLNPGSAPQIFPVDFDYFYLDGNATYPTLIDMDGNIIDGFYNNPLALNDTITSPGSTWTMNQGHNGVQEFQIGDEYFLLMAATNTAKAPNSSFRLFKFKDAAKEFKDLECLWTFPQAGMGVASNSYRTAVPYVEVSGTTANLFVYAGENGYGVYHFDTKGTVGISKEVDASAVTAIAKGKTVSLSESVALVKVVSLTGQVLSTSVNTDKVTVPASGLYLLQITSASGKTSVSKVAVK